MRVAARIGAANGIASDGGDAYSADDDDEDDDDDDADADFCAPGTEARLAAAMLI